LGSRKSPGGRACGQMAPLDVVEVRDNSSASVDEGCQGEVVGSLEDTRKGMRELLEGCCEDGSLAGLLDSDHDTTQASATGSDLVDIRDGMRCLMEDSVEKGSLATLFDVEPFLQVAPAHLDAVGEVGEETGVPLTESTHGEQGDNHALAKAIIRNAWRKACARCPTDNQQRSDPVPLSPRSPVDNLMERASCSTGDQERSDPVQVPAIFSVDNTSECVGCLVEEEERPGPIQASPRSFVEDPNAVETHNSSQESEVHASNNRAAGAQDPHEASAGCGALQTVVKTVIRYAYRRACATCVDDTSSMPVLLRQRDVEVVSCGTDACGALSKERPEPAQADRLSHSLALPDDGSIDSPDVPGDEQPHHSQGTESLGHAGELQGSYLAPLSQDALPPPLLVAASAAAAMCWPPEPAPPPFPRRAPPVPRSVRRHRVEDAPWVTSDAQPPRPPQFKVAPPSEPRPAGGRVRSSRKVRQQLKCYLPPVLPPLAPVRQQLPPRSEWGAVGIAGGALGDVHGRSRDLHMFRDQLKKLENQITARVDADCLPDP